MLEHGIEQDKIRNRTGTGTKLETENIEGILVIPKFGVRNSILGILGSWCEAVIVVLKG